MELGRRSLSSPDDAPERNRPPAEVSTHFDLDSEDDVSTLDDVRLAFSDHMQDPAEPYHRCIWKPASLLPYPRPVIHAALTALLDFAERRRSSRYLDDSLRSDDAITAIKNALDFLGTYLDVAPSDLPTDPSENLVAAEQFLEHERSLQFGDETNAPLAQREPLATSLARTVARLTFPLDVAHASREELAAFLLTSVAGALPHGLELALGQRAVKQAVWPITFLYMGAIALSTIMEQEGTPIALDAVIEQMVTGVLPFFSGAKRARVFTAADATVMKVLQNPSATEGVMVEVIGTATVAYAETGSTEALAGLAELCRVLEREFRIADP